MTIAFSRHSCFAYEVDGWSHRETAAGLANEAIHEYYYGLLRKSGIGHSRND